METKNRSLKDTLFKVAMGVILTLFGVVSSMLAFAVKDLHSNVQKLQVGAANDNVSNLERNADQGKEFRVLLGEVSKKQDVLIVTSNEISMNLKMTMKKLDVPYIEPARRSNKLKTEPYRVDNTWGDMAYVIWVSSKNDNNSYTIE